MAARLQIKRDSDRGMNIARTAQSREQDSRWLQMGRAGSHRGYIIQVTLAGGSRFPSS